jgi:oxygen-independent coproporphyrinogen-3 oxidase
VIAPESTPSASTPATALLASELRAPRYTSYPTALSFKPDFPVMDFVTAARQSARSAEPLSLYLHVPFCASNCYYCGCNRVVSRNAQRIARYCEALEREILLKSVLVGSARRVTQVHFGGGTPNSLSSAQLSGLIDWLRRRFRLAAAPELELSIEADPRLATPEALRDWRAIGFNRLSFGVQDIDGDVQKAINRLQSADKIAELTAAARDIGFESVNYDLVYGLPLQTVERFAATLDFVLQQRPERVAVFHYAHLPQVFAPQKAIRDKDIPPLATRLELRRLAHERLVAGGYQAIGLDHYALPSDALAQAQSRGTLRRNFQGYTAMQGRDVLGLGVSAISQLGRTFAQNERDLGEYLAAIADDRLPIARGYRQTADDALRADIIEAVMCRGVVDYAEIAQRHGLETPSFGSETVRLRELDPEGSWLRCDEQGLSVEGEGRHLLRLVARVFDRHVAEPARMQTVA